MCLTERNGRGVRGGGAESGVALHLHPAALSPVPRAIPPAMKNWRAEAKPAEVQLDVGHSPLPRPLTKWHCRGLSQVLFMQSDGGRPALPPSRADKMALPWPVAGAVHAVGWRACACGAVFGPQGHPVWPRRRIRRIRTHHKKGEGSGVGGLGGFENSIPIPGSLLRKYTLDRVSFARPMPAPSHRVSDRLLAIRMPPLGSQQAAGALSHRHTIFDNATPSFHLPLYTPPTRHAVSHTSGGRTSTRRAFSPSALTWEAPQQTSRALLALTSMCLRRRPQVCGNGVNGVAGSARWEGKKGKEAEAVKRLFVCMPLRCVNRESSGLREGLASAKWSPDHVWNCPVAAPPPTAIRPSQRLADGIFLIAWRSSPM
eukprot:365133-Chlamydomonas_euryale.AAC.5